LVVTASHFGLALFVIVVALMATCLGVYLDMRRSTALLEDPTKVPTVARRAEHLAAFRARNDQWRPRLGWALVCLSVPLLAGLLLAIFG
jgi:hypothetical protein